MDIVWDGITRLEDLSEDSAKVRLALADAARSCDWSRVFGLLERDGHQLVNTTRPGGSSLFAPLHQAAYCGAPVQVVERLIGMHAFRTLQNARGERAVDVAERRNHPHLLEVLTPQIKHPVPSGVLLKVQARFQEVILDRAGELVREHLLRLPELEPLLELDPPEMWFSVPGMYGGFSFRLVRGGVEAQLVSTSWCRIVEGSGQRHEITSAGSDLVEEGFV